MKIMMSYSELASYATENANVIDLNESQEFYKWLHTQSNPSSRYGSGTWSRSSIEEAALNNPQLLQEYADRFVQQKAQSTLYNFEKSNHLLDGAKEIQSINSQNASTIHQTKHIDSRFNQSNMEVAKAVQDASIDKIEAVDKNLTQNVNARINEDRTHLANSANKEEHEAIPLQEQITEKIKGQVIGSNIHTVPGSLADEMKKPKITLDNLFHKNQE